VENSNLCEHFSQTILRMAWGLLAKVSNRCNMRGGKGKGVSSAKCLKNQIRNVNIAKQCVKLDEGLILEPGPNNTHIKGTVS